MQNIAVVFGGKSVEHDISIITGVGVLQNLSQGYHGVPIYIDKEGNWWTGEKLCYIENFKDFNTKKLKKCNFCPNDKRLHIYGMRRTAMYIDCVINCLHGQNGEDGSLSGVLQLSGIPETSSGVLGNAVCMDKGITKLLLRSKRVPITRFITININDYNANNSFWIRNIIRRVGLPCIIKPARGGSSIGISVANDIEQLEILLENVAKYDNEIIIEQYLPQFREINIALFEHDGNLELSSLEEVVGADKIFDFDNKYTTNTKTKRICPANIDASTKDNICKLAKKVYSICKCRGIVRIDFFVTEDKILVNEVNTVPGSMSFYLWKDFGYTFGRVLSKLIIEGKKRFVDDQKHCYKYNSNILDNLSKRDFIMNK